MAYDGWAILPKGKYLQITYESPTNVPYSPAHQWLWIKNNLDRNL